MAFMQISTGFIYIIYADILLALIKATTLNMYVCVCIYYYEIV